MATWKALIQNAGSIGQTYVRIARSARLGSHATQRSHEMAAVMDRLWVIRSFDDDKDSVRTVFYREGWPQ